MLHLTLSPLIATYFLSQQSFAVTKNRGDEIEILNSKWCLNLFQTSENTRKPPSQILGNHFHLRLSLACHQLIIGRRRGIEGHLSLFFHFIFAALFLLFFIPFRAGFLSFICKIRKVLLRSGQLFGPSLLSDSQIMYQE